ncbi:uncharacterized protein SCHCODRAFT_01325139 [Schizophyllum commune H4-8]|uniref:uncharacterized protein n=1 Tax=Schizophyllum commune (strain H4-8 / FGSC 9210) TaxID=578458 RepID=UPI00215FBF15|nr:uncharacterized protein SCHCODRAFT_01325139 [Schizophyllum commune H4-8]KAI5889400.1 hypothetical protein SCHCODRAFT_01325139 [Schizophyllum commune H4-8]
MASDVLARVPRLPFAMFGAPQIARPPGRSGRAPCQSSRARGHAVADPARTQASGACPPALAPRGGPPRARGQRLSAPKTRNRARRKGSGTSARPAMERHG